MFHLFQVDKQSLCCETANRVPCDVIVNGGEAGVSDRTTLEGLMLWTGTPYRVPHESPSSEVIGTGLTYLIST